MKKILIPFLVLAVITAFSFSSNAEGIKKSIPQYSSITDIDMNLFTGVAQVHRDFRGVDFQLHSIDSIEPGHAYTAWANIDDDGDGTFEILFRVAGGIVGDSRELKFNGRIPRGKIPAENGESILSNEGDGRFNKPRKAAIVFFIRDHGMILEDQVTDQITKINGGCEENECMTFQITRFESPEH